MPPPPARYWTVRLMVEVTVTELAAAETVTW